MTPCGARASVTRMSARQFGLIFAIVAACAASLGGGAGLAQQAPPKTNQPPSLEGAPADNPQTQAPQPRANVDDAAAAMIGTWEFSNADRNKVCRFTFRSETTAGGRRIEIDKNCPSLFPSTKDISGWALDNYGDLRLIDKQGDAVIELTQVESGMYDGFSPGEG